MDKTKGNLQEDILRTKTDISEKLDSNDRYYLDQFDTLRELAGREKQFVTQKLEEMRDSVTAEMSNECKGLKDFVKDTTHK